MVMSSIFDSRSVGGLYDVPVCAWGPPVHDSPGATACGSAAAAGTASASGEPLTGPGENRQGLTKTPPWIGYGTDVMGQAVCGSQATPSLKFARAVMYFAKVT